MQEWSWESNVSDPSRRKIGVRQLQAAESEEKCWQPKQRQSGVICSIQRIRGVIHVLWPQIEGKICPGLVMPGMYKWIEVSVVSIHSENAKRKLFHRCFETLSLDGKSDPMGDWDLSRKRVHLLLPRRPWSGTCLSLWDVYTFGPLLQSRYTCNFVSLCLRGEE